MDRGSGTTASEGLKLGACGLAARGACDLGHDSARSWGADVTANEPPKTLASPSPSSNTAAGVRGDAASPRPGIASLGRRTEPRPRRGLVDDRLSDPTRVVFVPGGVQPNLNRRHRSIGSRRRWRVDRSPDTGASFGASAAPPLALNAAQQRLSSRSHRWSRQFGSPSASQAMSQVDPAARTRNWRRSCSKGRAVARHLVGPAHVVVAELDPLGTTPMGPCPRQASSSFSVPVPALATARCDAASHPAARSCPGPPRLAASTAASASAA
jgi:hypothetical protein